MGEPALLFHIWQVTAAGRRLSCRGGALSGAYPFIFKRRKMSFVNRFISTIRGLARREWQSFLSHNQEGFRFYDKYWA